MQANNSFAVVLAASLAVDWTCHCRGDLLEALTMLDSEEDVNKILKYFSYEHFYVIYCKVRAAFQQHRPACNW